MRLPTAFLPLPLLPTFATRFWRQLLIQINSMSATAHKSVSAKTIATHNGAFHCDEVLACYMLKTHVPQFIGSRIIRTRDPDLLATADIVVDVGAIYKPEEFRFDHHQRGFDTTFSPTGKRSTTKLSSAGLIYKHFGIDVIQHVASLTNIDLTKQQLTLVYHKLYDSFMEAIDAIDNGIERYQSAGKPQYESSTDLSSRVGFFNPEWYDINPDQDANFASALNLAGKEMDEAIVHVLKSWLPARSILVNAMKERYSHHESGQILVLTQRAPWKDHLFTLEQEESANAPDGNAKPQILYVVYEDMTGSSWRVQCVASALGSFQSRKPLPEHWRGVRDAKISELTGIPDCIFVHPSGFVGGNKSFEGALQMAKKSLIAS